MVGQFGPRIMLTPTSRAPTLAHVLLVAPSALLFAACQAGPSDDSVLDRALSWIDQVEYYDVQQSSQRRVTLGPPSSAPDTGTVLALPPRAPTKPLKLDAKGIGFYSNVQVALLQRQGSRLCALFTRDGKGVAAGCAQALSSTARQLSDRLLDNSAVRVFMDHHKQFGRMHGYDSYRIVKLEE